MNRPFGAQFATDLRLELAVLQFLRDIPSQCLDWPGGRVRYPSS